MSQIASYLLEKADATTTLPEKEPTYKLIDESKSKKNGEATNQRKLSKESQTKNIIFRQMKQLEQKASPMSSSHKQESVGKYKVMEHKLTKIKTLV